ncbi:2-amino-4-hydroxy-6-hydroxymethyldihydropteridine diphosphokinase [Bowmanella dokdonensis]|uniref:2-amino-4-hydroxy-6-hydroxymethyldihydropteridine diphosphokinase n=1 Tax=Bowmanella dokdonensis TaxID=751969 RepID=A0A939DR13_9ALTE|nr:2-amino-4-hydroxy-6-hydroxymethyldihydropteridine diphosphokinase [Bowmanella dokdonensis]MBN7826645.1 2-amino-4-hydroxy-6-hydroxymethyldihydropteridine diphosphokinase [Bowmanella dokdonensis]
MATVYISLGSNVDREIHTRSGLDALHRYFNPLTLSRLFESEAIGFDGSPFYNMVIKGHTKLALEQVLVLLKGIESANGRRPGDKKFAPRTLDLDLLLYDALVTRAPVVLPREEILYNAFVLWPLSELAPTFIHPQTGDSLASLWQQFDKQSQTLTPIDFTWKPKYDPD